MAFTRSPTHIPHQYPWFPRKRTAPFAYYMCGWWLAKWNTQFNLLEATIISPLLITKSAQFAEILVSLDKPTRFINSSIAALTTQTPRDWEYIIWLIYKIISLSVSVSSSFRIYCTYFNAIIELASTKSVGAVGLFISARPLYIYMCFCLIVIVKKAELLVGHYLESDRFNILFK